jgi:MtrB/PioB family decaheme-associated outer membrane protein
MRTKTLIFVVALLAGWVSAASAQASGQEPGQQVSTSSPWLTILQNSLDGGARITDFSGDPSRFQRYRDERTGPFLDRFRFSRNSGSFSYDFAFDNIGYRDQRYFGQWRKPGKVKITAEWNQIPLWYEAAHGSERDISGMYVPYARSPYSGVGTDRLTLPAGLQAAVQSGTASLSDYVPFAVANTFNVRDDQNIFRFNLTYYPTLNTDVDLYLSTTSSRGTRPWSTSLGFALSAIEVAAPVDTRTTDVGAGAEWGDGRYMAKIHYDGSWFSDSNKSLTIDNPFVAVSSATGGSALERFALWPDNNSQTVTGAGAVKLPAHSHLSANVAVGTWRQNAPLLPVTANSAIGTEALPRTTTEGNDRRIAANLVFSTRPVNYLGLTARYRRYDFKNHTPDEFISQVVQYDQTFQEGDTPALFDHTHNNADIDLSITAPRYVSFSVGYRLNHDTRTERVFGTTNDNTFYATADTFSMGMLSFHGIYEHSVRRGSNYDLEVLTDAGEYEGLQRYDIANFDRNSWVGMLQVMPVPSFAFTASATYALDDFVSGFPSEDAFGLRQRKAAGYSAFVTYSPDTILTLGAGYGFQNYTTLQQSRQSGSASQTTAPFDWTAGEDQKVNYFSANLALNNLGSKAALRVTYDYNHSASPYVYTTGPSLAAPQQLPPVVDTWQTGTADLRYFVLKNLAIGFTYWYDRYKVNDFALGSVQNYVTLPASFTSSTIPNNVVVPGVMLLGYGFRPYISNSYWVRMFYVF